MTALDPGEGDSVSDEVFAGAVERVSSEGSLRFTTRQLYYELRRSLGAVERDASSVERFDELLARWQAVHGDLPGVVTPRSMAPTPPREADIGDYSFDRVVIADSAWMVDFLLANNFHFETNSAVLSENGHPADRFDMIRGMLRKNPRIIVIAIHDASVEGCGLSRRLVSDEGWFRDLGHVVDVGLNPAHRELYAGSWQARSAVAVSDAPDDTDASWLSQYSIELAVVRPEKVMRRLFRATRRFGALLTDPAALPIGQVHSDDAVLGPGKQRRLLDGEEAD